MSNLLERFPNLVCPLCQKPALKLDNDEIRCQSCSEKYKLIDGKYPRMLPSNASISQQEVVVQDKVAVDYEHKRYSNPWSKAYHQWWTDLMISQVDISGKILDNGCGVGKLFDQLPDADITGLDISQEMVRLAGQKSECILIGDSQQLPFADETFDIVFARSLIHHLPNPSRGISEMARVLRHKGEIVSVDTNCTLLSSIPRALANRGEHFSEEHKNFHRKELLKMFASHFHIESVRFFGYIAYPILGFPDLIDLFRFFPAKNLSYKLLIATDEFISRIPLIRSQGWGLLIKGRKIQSTYL